MMMCASRYKKLTKWQVRLQLSKAKLLYVGYFEDKVGTMVAQCHHSHIGAWSQSPRPKGRPRPNKPNRIYRVITQIIPACSFHASPYRLTMKLLRGYDTTQHSAHHSADSCTAQANVPPTHVQFYCAATQVAAARAYDAAVRQHVQDPRPDQLNFPTDGGEGEAAAGGVGAGAAEGVAGSGGVQGHVGGEVAAAGCGRDAAGPMDVDAAGVATHSGAAAGGAAEVGAARSMEVAAAGVTQVPAAAEDGMEVDGVCEHQGAQAQVGSDPAPAAALPNGLGVACAAADAGTATPHHLSCALHAKAGAPAEGPGLPPSQPAASPCSQTQRAEATPSDGAAAPQAGASSPLAPEGQQHAFRLRQAGPTPDVAGTAAAAEAQVGVGQRIPAPGPVPSQPDAAAPGSCSTTAEQAQAAVEPEQTTGMAVDHDGLQGQRPGAEQGGAGSTGTHDVRGDVRMGEEGHAGAALQLGADEAAVQRGGGTAGRQATDTVQAARVNGGGEASAVEPLRMQVDEGKASPTHTALRFSSPPPKPSAAAASIIPGVSTNRAATAMRSALLTASAAAAAMVAGRAAAVPAASHGSSAGCTPAAPVAATAAAAPAPAAPVTAAGLAMPPPAATGHCGLVGHVAAPAQGAAPSSSSLPAPVHSLAVQVAAQPGSTWPCSTEPRGTGRGSSTEPCSTRHSSSTQPGSAQQSGGSTGPTSRHLPRPRPLCFAPPRQRAHAGQAAAGCYEARGGD